MAEKIKNKKLLTVSPAPHFHRRDSISRSMWLVIVALMPALGASLYFFGIRALQIEAVAVISALLTEGVILKLRGKPVVLKDGSAAVAGLLLAFNLPPGVPLWLPAVGSAVGIGVGKQLFGGLGYNIFNPALIGRTFVMHSWLTRMTTWSPPRTALYQGVDALTYATPLGAAKEAVADWIPAQLGLKSLLVGNIGGCLGETSALALLAGAALLLFYRVIRWEAPAAFIGTVALLVWILPVQSGSIEISPLHHIFSGGLMLGAFFMATDPVTTPLSGKGMFIFGLGCGILTAIIRLYGGFPEGVCYSILIMNAFTPLIDKFTAPRVFGLTSAKTANLK